MNAQHHGPEQDVIRPRHRVGIDVGGTFTDFVIAREDGDRTESFKILSTPDDPSRAVLEGLSRITRSIVGADGISHIVHGTTIGINAIVQRRGARVGLVISRGFRDVLQLSQRLPEEYNLRQPHLPSLVERSRILETSARLDSTGTLLSHADDAEIAELASELRRRRVTAVGVSLLHGYAAPEIEAEFSARLATELGEGVHVSNAAAIWPQIREYERTSLTVLNAYIHPLMHSYLTSLQRSIVSLGITAPLFVTTSGGGCMGVEAAKARPVQTVLSGPASGVVAAGLLAHQVHDRGIISLDMGGTSTDISVIRDDKPSYATRTEVGGIPLITPVVDVNAIGTGGGSIVSVDAHGMLRVGPESAGASPGPIAFGNGGTQLTLTDVYLLAGIISPDAVLRRFGALDLRGAEEAALGLARELGSQHDDPLAFVLASILEISTVLATSEMQKVLARNGYAAEEFTIAPFGGAGPVAGALLADEVGIDSVIVPLHAGTFCALGAAWSPIRGEFLRGLGQPLRQCTDRLNDLARLLYTEATRWAADQVDHGQGIERIDCLTSFSGRYRGQAFTLDVDLTSVDLPASASTLEELFHDAHERRFGFRDHTSPIDVVAVSAVVTIPASGRPRLTADQERLLHDDAPEGDDPAGAARRPFDGNGRRRLLSGDTWMLAPTFTLAALASAVAVEGPAVIDLPDTTVLIPARWWGGLTADGAAIALTRHRRHPDSVLAEESPADASASTEVVTGANRTDMHRTDTDRIDNPA